MSLGSARTNHLDDALPSGGAQTRQYESGQQSALNLSPRIRTDESKSPRLDGFMQADKINMDLHPRTSQQKSHLNIKTLIIDKAKGSQDIKRNDHANTIVTYRNEKIKLAHLLEMRVLLHDIISEQYLVSHISGEQIFKDMH